MPKGNIENEELLLSDEKDVGFESEREMLGNDISDFFTIMNTKLRIALMVPELVVTYA